MAKKKKQGLNQKQSMLQEIKELKKGIDNTMQETLEEIQEIEQKQQKRKSSVNFFVTVVP